MKKDINMQLTEEKISVTKEDEKPLLSLVIKDGTIFFLSMEAFFF